MDKEVAEEVILKAEECLQKIAGIDEPNTLKVAGHYAFWIRKLKPFRVFKIGVLVEMLNARGIAHNIDSAACEQTSAGVALHLYLNEMIAVRYATALIKQRGIRLSLRPELLHDLVTSLRYNSYSPSALRIVFEGMVVSTTGEERKPA